MITFSTKTVTDVHYQGQTVANITTKDSEVWKLVWCNQYYFLNNTDGSHTTYTNLADAISRVATQFR